MHTLALPLPLLIWMSFSPDLNEMETEPTVALSLQVDCLINADNYAEHIAMVRAYIDALLPFRYVIVQYPFRPSSDRRPDYGTGSCESFSESRPVLLSTHVEQIHHAEHLGVVNLDYRSVYYYHKYHKRGGRVPAPGKEQRKN